MSATFNRPKNMRYTQMCMYIDAHMQEIVESNKNPEIEAKIFEYLYHIVYALACKSGYFKKFDDYDLFACYGATELFMSMRKKLQNAGKIVHGRVVAPIKNTLDFVKAVMYPLKINFQRDFFLHVIDPAICDTSILERNMRENIQRKYRGDISESYKDATSEIPKYIWKIIKRSPFSNDQLFCKKLYISCVLTLINNLTLPNKVKEKLDKKTQSLTLSETKLWQKLSTIYKSSTIDVILWHIPENIDNYIRILLRQVIKKFSKTVHYYIHADDLSDELLDGIMRNVNEVTDYAQDEVE